VEGEKIRSKAREGKSNEQEVDEVVKMAMVPRSFKIRKFHL